MLKCLIFAPLFVAYFSNICVFFLKIYYYNVEYLIFDKIITKF